MTPRQTIKRLTYLQGLIGKYAHRWNESDRVMGWVYEYNDIRNELYGYQATPEQNQIWVEYCNLMEYATSHTGHDCLA